MSTFDLDVILHAIREHTYHGCPIIPGIATNLARDLHEAYAQLDAQTKTITLLRRAPVTVTTTTEKLNRLRDAVTDARGTALHLADDYDELHTLLVGVVAVIDQAHTYINTGREPGTDCATDCAACRALLRIPERILGAARAHNETTKGLQ